MRRTGNVFTLNVPGDMIYAYNEFVSIHTRSHIIPGSMATVLTALAIKDHFSETVLEFWWSEFDSRDVVRQTAELFLFFVNNYFLSDCGWKEQK